MKSLKKLMFTPKRGEAGYVKWNFQPLISWANTEYIVETLRSYYRVEKQHVTGKATSRPQASAIPTCGLDIPATGFLLSMSLNDKDEKSLMCFQRKPNDWAVRLGAREKSLKARFNLGESNLTV